MSLLRFPDAGLTVLPFTMRRDSLFYQLFAQLSQTLFDLLGIDTPQGYRFDSVELKQTAFLSHGWRLRAP